MLAWPMLGLVAYLLVLQGLIGNYAQAASVMGDATGGSVICTHLGVVDNSEPGAPDPLKHDCCAIACQSAGGKVMGNGAAAPVLARNFTEIRVSLDMRGAAACPTTWTAQVPDARAPPAFS
ncbi:hypothetical protein GCM10010136_00220 [Limoniibacter endophyticus]|uniref:Uncharacterized protein n=1 Tax=Limoniibacter endophyticus TaxID=1565040 RepID=A0A8J3DLF8_9HYPH|nr:hypothetical protein GCM10010136_00220 [Limoniibacter endophyticus]